MLFFETLWQQLAIPDHAVAGFMRYAKHVIPVLANNQRIFRDGIIATRLADINTCYLRLYIAVAVAGCEHCRNPC